MSLCQWFTPPGVAKAFLEWSRVSDDDLVLDPAAGEGALCPDREGVIAFEVDEALVPELRYWRPQATVICANFLKTPPAQADVAVLNPPYDDEGEATFVRQSLLWAPRACALVRAVAVNGPRRYEACWRHVRFTRIAYLLHRPHFLGPGGVDTQYHPMADYMAIECVRGSGPSTVEISWVGWK